MFDRLKRMATAFSTDSAAVPAPIHHVLATGGYNMSPALDIIDDGALELLYRDCGLAKMLVRLPVDESIRAWRNWDGDDDQNTLIEALERRLDVTSTMRDALINARLFGGCAVLMGVSGQGDFNEPLDPTKVTADSLMYLQILPRVMFNIEAINTDVGSDIYGEPTKFVLTPNGQASITNVNPDGSKKVNPEIHRSRLIVFKGDTTPSAHGINSVREYWGYSVLQALYTPLVQLKMARGDLSGLINQSSTPVISIKGYRKGLADEQVTEAGVAMEMALIDRQKSNFKTIIIDAEDKFELHKIPLTGYDKAIQVLTTALAGVSGIPHTKLFGESPSGLLSSGNNERKDFQDLITSVQRNSLQPPMNLLDIALVHAAGLGSTVNTQGNEISYEWAALETPTPLEADQAFGIRLDAILKAQQMGVITPDEAREEYKLVRPDTSENS